MKQHLLPSLVEIPFLWAASLVTGALITLWMGDANFISGLIATSTLLTFGLVALRVAWRWSGGGRALAAVMITALVLRLVVGLFLTWGLPLFGYEGRNQSAGYVFSDAYMRDRAAWQIASAPERTLLAAFDPEFTEDQYGGMLFLSATIYRALSPDAHRQHLMILAAACAAALGLPFLWRALRQRWQPALVLLACWIAALYPDSVLLGSAQMREPFLVTLLCMGFWAVAAWSGGRAWKRIALLALVLPALFLLSLPVGVAGAGMLAAWWLLEKLDWGEGRVWGWLVWAGLGFAAILGLLLGTRWLQASAAWDLSLMLKNSGMVQAVTQGMPEPVRLVFLVAYGLLQPVLPAAVTDPAPLIWQTIGILRGLGWYTLLPLILYPVFALRGLQDARQRRTLIWVWLACWLWIVISSLRAGGDQWDNPRYRVIFMPWLALLAAWCWEACRKARWFWRAAAVEGIFLVLFLEWYLSRQITWLPHLSFTLTVGLVVALSAILLAGSWLWDHFKKPLQKSA
ncbi:MAG TPA: hypothetical protein PKW33_02675 [Anaerolineaceae bacterium]|nr:hypothetical protein [Anaerolineaceae bacterium]HPN50466.1 hypothetical protein [Anaerolineaceae bacterium]